MLYSDFCVFLSQNGCTDPWSRWKSCWVEKWSAQVMKIMFFYNPAWHIYSSSSERQLHMLGFIQKKKTKKNILNIRKQNMDKDSWLLEKPILSDNEGNCINANKSLPCSLSKQFLYYRGYKPIKQRSNHSKSLWIFIEQLLFLCLLVFF